MSIIFIQINQKLINGITHKGSWKYCLFSQKGMLLNKLQRVYILLETIKKLIKGMFHCNNNSIFNYTSILSLKITKRYTLFQILILNFKWHVLAFSTFKSIYFNFCHSTLEGWFFFFFVSIVIVSHNINPFWSHIHFS